MTGFFNPANFWPQHFAPDGVGHLSHFVYPDVGSVPGYTSTFFYDPPTKAMKLVQYDLHNNFMSNWYLQARPDGLFEVQDDLPQTNATLKKLFGPLIVEKYATPIGWGYPESLIGEAFAYRNTPSFAPLSCRPPQWGSGVQVVLFEELYPTWADPTGKVWENVLQMLYQQQWGSGIKMGARMMMPYKVGPIASQWVSGSTVEPWQYAKLTTT